MMEQAIKDFAKQFRFKPEIKNSDRYSPTGRFIVCGMGGSHLAADILQSIEPKIDLAIRRDYGLPERTDGATVVVSSYSGNTEEALDAYEQVRQHGLPMLAIAVGGKLIEQALRDNVPYIQLPDTGIQPRSALGFSFLALLKALGQDELLNQASALNSLKPLGCKPAGKELAKKLKGKVPVIYASTRNKAVAYNWKIKLNETGKLPAFMNVVPELNHNEMTGFDAATPATKRLVKPFSVVMLTDAEDHPQIQKRMTILEQLFTGRELPVTLVPLEGSSRLEKVFSSLLTADWLAVTLAKKYHAEAEQVPMIEEFKKLME